MSPSLTGYLDESVRLLEATRVAFDDGRMDRAVALISHALKQGGPLLVCGNGGSAADAQHIVGELVGRFLVERQALNAICLSSNVSVVTAWANDYSYDDIFARQVEAHCATGAGVLLCISTSGNSNNVVRAAETARRLGLPVISLTGDGGGRLATCSSVLLDVPSSTTPMIQQAHMCLYHYLCARIEADAVQAGASEGRLVPESSPSTN